MIMKKVILMTGDLASGKSTYSEILKEKLHITVLNKDRFKEILGDRIPVSNREENKNLSVVCFNLFKYILEQSEYPILIESNFKPYEFDELRELLKDTKVMTIILTGDEKVLHKRFNDRLLENRHFIHKSQDFTNIEPFIETLKELRSITPIGEVLSIDATDFSYQEDVNVISKIQEFLSRGDEA